jgi:hypothetical protein
MTLQYPHLKHNMSAGFLDGLYNNQMLGIKYACSMKKMMMVKKLKIRRNKRIVINNRKNNLEQEKEKKLKREKVKEIRKKIQMKNKMPTFWSQNM